MGYVLGASANGEVVTVPVGTTVGTVFVNKHDVTWRGSDRDTCILQLDDFSASAHSGFVFAYPPQTPDTQPVRSISLQNMTIDANSLSTLVSVISSTTYAGPLAIRLKNVAIKNHHANTIAIVTNDCQLTMRRVMIYGDGKSVVLSGGVTDASDIDIEGGLGGFIVSAIGAQASVNLRRVHGWNAWWHLPRRETVTPTAVTSTYLDVASHTTGDRSLYDVIRILQIVGTGTSADGSVVAITGARVYDRIETAAGVWAQVESIQAGTGYAVVTRWRAAQSWMHAATPSDVTTLTLYRMITGRLLNWTSTRLSLIDAGATVSATWRYPNGEPATTPILGDIARVDLCLSGTANRRADVGGIHLTDPVVDSQILDCDFIGWWSDIITIRGHSNRAIRCSSDLGQDMGWTLTGENMLLDRCYARRAGFDGFFISNATETDAIKASGLLQDCFAIDAGAHRYVIAADDNGSVGFGVLIYEEDAPARIDVTGLRGQGNHQALYGGVMDVLEYRGQAVP